MERDFWLERWQSDQIGFHQSAVNPLLEKHWPSLQVGVDGRVFVPLCGKSLDMRWLESHGHHVYGVDFSRKALDAYFAEGGETALEDSGDYLVRLRGAHSTLYCGDFLDLSAPDIIGTQGVFDRGALVALPPMMRLRYVDHLLRIVHEQTVMLLVTLEYDESLVDGPPFSVIEEEVGNLFARRGAVTKLDERIATNLPPKFAANGVNSALECVYRIVKES